MARIRMRNGLRMLLDGREHRIASLLDESRIDVEDVETGAVSRMTNQEITALFFDKKIEFLQETRAQGDQASLCGDINFLPDKEMDIALYRYAVIEPLLGKPLSDGVVKEHLATLHDLANPRGQKPPSIASIYRWIRDYNDSGQDVRALVPSFRRSGGRGRPRSTAELNDMIDGVLQRFFLTRRRPSMQQAYDVLVGEIAAENAPRPPGDKLTTPSYVTFTRRIHDLPRDEVLARRHGKRAARNSFEPVKQGPKPTRILERVECDGTPLHLILVDEEDKLVLGRPQLTFLLDSYSRYPLGFYLGFEPESYAAVMECLRHAIMPKHYVGDVFTKYPIQGTWSAFGLPELLIVDNHKAFENKHLKHACLQLNICLDYNPVRSPWFKGRLERFFRTLNESLVHCLPGTTFSNIMDKGHDYDPSKDAILTLESFLNILHIWLVDVYSEKFSKGAGGIPRQIWNEGANIHPPALPVNADELLILLGKIEQRLLRRVGIELEGLFYNSHEVAFLRTRARSSPLVTVKYSPNDMSKIWIYDEHAQRYIEIPALDQEYTRNLSLWKHRIIRRYALETAGKVNQETLMAARRNIAQIVKSDVLRFKKGKTNKTHARWNDQNSNSIQNLAREGQYIEIPDAIRKGVKVPQDGAGTGNITNDTCDTVTPDDQELNMDGWSASYDLPKLGD